MELYAFHREFFMAQPHDFSFGCPGAYLQAGRQGFGAHNKGMITSGGEGIGQSREDGSAVMMNRRDLSVHDSSGADNLTSESVTDGLVPQADDHDRYCFVKFVYDLHSNPRIKRCAGNG